MLADRRAGLTMLIAFVCALTVSISLLDVVPALAQVGPTNSAVISGTVSDSSGRPVAGAKVLLIGPRVTSTRTGANGQFSFVGVPLGNYLIVSEASGLGTAARSNVSVQGDINVAIRYEPSKQGGLQTIATVSSNANATFNVTPSSITQVSPVANALQGETSWRKILEQIPGVAQSGLGVGFESFAAIPDAPMVPVTVSINGTLPYETAVLLDGMPLIGSSNSSQAAGIDHGAGFGTDVGNYSMNSFGSADVVRGPGANSPSIVDSVGGSLVLHPAASTVLQNHIDFSASSDPYGGIVANLVGAFRTGKLSTVVTYGLNDSPGPINGVGIPASTIAAPSSVNGQSFVPYSPPCTAPTCVYGGYLVNPHYASSAFANYGYQTGLLICCEDQNTAWSQQGGSLSLSYAASPSLNATMFFTGNTASMSIPYDNYTVDFAPPPGYAGSIPSGEHEYSANGQYLGPAPSMQSSSLLEEKVAAQIGPGVLRVAALQNRVFLDSSASSASSQYLQLYGAGYLNGSTTPTFFNGSSAEVTFPTTVISEAYQSNNRDMLVSYDLSGQNIRGGASFVSSYYNNPLQVFEAEGGLNFSDSTSPSISETTDELRVYVGANPSERTSLDLSDYFVDANYHVPNPNGGNAQLLTPAPAVYDYSQPSAYTNANYSYSAPRLGFVWRPSSTLSLRSSAGGGFAEAPLNYLVGSNGVPIDSGTGYYTVTRTNLGLKPETSFAFDVGADERLASHTVASLDLYRTNLFGQLYNSTSIDGTYLGLPLYATQYGNLGVSRYEGVLVDLRHDVPRGLYWTVAGGLTRGYVVSVPGNFYNTASGTCDRATGANCTNINVVTGVNFNGTFTSATIPYSQASGSLGYRWKPDESVGLVGTYYGNNNTYFRPAFVEFDGFLKYPVSARASLLLSARNITGIYDGSIQSLTSQSFIGAPTITGAPYPMYGGEYGPRAMTLTFNEHL